MANLMWVVLALIFLGCSQAASATSSGAKKERYVMPWMCLEICDSEDQIAEQLSVIQTKAHVLSGVSFEKYSLGDDCRLVTNETLSNVNQQIVDNGLDNWPMISSYPHPPEFMDWMRKLIYAESCALDFIGQAISEAKDYKYVGYNLDLEPVLSNMTEPITQRDAAAYAAFIDLFSTKLHEDGLKLAVRIREGAL